MTHPHDRDTETRHDLPRSCDPGADAAVHVRAEPESDVVRVTGELDADTVDQVRECLQRLPASDGPRLVVDLGEVDTIDWNGIGVLVAARRRLREHGGELVLRCPTTDALRLLDRSGVQGLFTIEA